MSRVRIWLSLLLFVGMPLAGFAQEEAAEVVLNAGDTAWMLIATGLVAMMTPAGLALFYGGMTPSRNVLNTVGMSYLAYAIVSVIWISIGYSLAFGPTWNGWGYIGTLENAFLNGIKVSDISGSIPTLLFVAFQGTFAAIACALVSGSVIERLKFESWIIFSILWTIFIYAPIAHWVWGGGFLAELGALDFAGGTVIHINAGVSGLIFAILIKRRLNPEESVTPYSIKFTVLGSALLWFGWFGFNAGSQLAADGIAANALLVTNTAAALGVIGWMLLEWLFTGRYTMFGAASGAVAGLVAITPASGFVDISAAMIIGLLGGLIGYFGVYELKKRTNVDDSLDTFGVHGLAGIWGAIATGIFANPEVNEAGTGLWYGNPNQIIFQLQAIGVTIVYSAVMTVVIYYITGFLTRGMRVNEEMELKGIDQSFHGETAS